MRLTRLTILLALLAPLAGCGSNPTTSTKPLRAVKNLPTPQPQGTPAPPSGDPRVTAALALLQQALAAPSVEYTHMLRYTKADGSKPWLKSRYRYQKSGRNHLELLGGSDSKVEGTKMAWQDGNGKVQVRTKFIGFWITTSLDRTDERMNDPLGNPLDDTSLGHFYATLKNPANQWTYVAEGALTGKPMTVLNLVSPASLKSITREVIGIDKTTGMPLLRDMYAGMRLACHETTEAGRLNPAFKSSDFAVE